MSFKIKLSGLLLAVAAVGAMTVSSVALAEDSLFNRLGGTYNIAQTVDHLVDKIYVNRKGI